MLRFAAGLGDEHLIRVLDDGLLKTVPPEEASPASPLLVSVTAANRVRENFASLFELIPESILAGLRENRYFLILDNSGEAPALPPAVLDTWYSTIRAHGIRPSRVAYISQDKSDTREHEDYCATNSIEDRVQFFHYHWYLKALAMTAHNEEMSEAAFVEKRDRFLQRSPEKAFLCLMGKARPERVGLALSLLQTQLWDKGIVSFGGFDAELARRQRAIETFGKAAQFDDSNPSGEEHPLVASSRYKSHPLITPERAAFMDDLIKQGRVVHEYARKTILPAHIEAAPTIFDLDDSLYYSTRFSIVSESEMKGKRSRFTEKSVKPLAHFHPIVIFGNVGVLPQLREIGFETHQSFVAERYDSINKVTRRFDAAFGQAKILAELPPSKWSELSRLNFEILEANARHFYFGLRRKLTVCLDQPLASALLKWQRSAI